MSEGVQLARLGSVSILTRSSDRMQHSVFTRLPSGTAKRVSILTRSSDRMQLRMTTKVTIAVNQTVSILTRSSDRMQLPRSES